MSAKKITMHNFQAEVLESDKPVLLDFWASWCGPCRMVSPVIDQIAEEEPGFKIGKVNIEEEEGLAAAFGVSSIPSLVVMKNGRVAARSVGARPKNEIKQMLRKAV